jgi:LuxR family maltose regulon positive regulatory protein
MSWRHCALAAAERASSDTSLEAAVNLAHAWAAAGDSENATRSLTAVLATHSGAPERVRLQAWLAEARLSYTSGHCVRGRISLASALRLAGSEQLRLPFAVERGWIGPVLRRASELAQVRRRPLAPTPGHDQLPAPRGFPDQAPIPAVEPLTDREREVLRHVSGLLSAAEVATEMYMSVNTHLTHIYASWRPNRRGEAVRRARQLELT